MADQASDTKAPEVPLDAEGRRLRLEAIKAGYRKQIAKAEQASTTTLASLVPSATDAPKGSVTLAADAGAYGSWQAHKLLDTLAAAIADRVVEAAGATKPAGEPVDGEPVDGEPVDGEPVDGEPGAPKQAGKPLAGEPVRVLVVQSLDLVTGNAKVDQVKATLARLKARLAPLPGQLAEVLEGLMSGVGRLGEQSGGGRRGGQRDLAPIGALNSGMGAAVDLLGLIRTDFNITPNTITATPSELAALTAAQLAKRHIQVEIDGFSSTTTTPSIRAMQEVGEMADQITASLVQIHGILAPIDAEMTSIASRLAIVEQQWAKVADGDDASPATALRDEVNRLAEASQARARATGSARALVDLTTKILTETDVALTSLTDTSPGGEAPILTALRRERLGADIAVNKISHVLYVSLDLIAADTVTRQTLIGASGVIQFLSATTATWLLLDTGSGAITHGGQADGANATGYSLTTGQIKGSAPQTDETGGWVKDPLTAIEGPARFMIAVLAVLLAVLGLAAAIAVVRVAVG